MGTPSKRAPERSSHRRAQHRTWQPLALATSCFRSSSLHPLPALSLRPTFAMYVFLSLCSTCTGSTRRCTSLSVRVSLLLGPVKQDICHPACCGSNFLVSSSLPSWATYDLLSLSLLRHCTFRHASLCVRGVIDTPRHAPLLVQSLVASSAMGTMSRYAQLTNALSLPVHVGTSSCILC